MINEHTYSYADGYLSTKILVKFDLDSDIRTAYRSMILSGNNTPEALSDFINTHLDQQTKTRLLAACRKFISRAKLARNNDGQRETTIKLTPKTRQQLEIFSKQFGLSMTDSLAILARHASEITNQQRLEIYKKYK